DWFYKSSPKETDHIQVSENLAVSLRFSCLLYAIYFLHFIFSQFTFLQFTFPQFTYRTLETDHFLVLGSLAVSLRLPYLFTCFGDLSFSSLGKSCSKSKTSIFNSRIYLFIQLCSWLTGVSSKSREALIPR